MATTNSQETSGLMDQSIPQWKRELILRRRALGRTICVGNSSVKLTCPGVVAAVRHPEASENAGKQQRCIAATNKSWPNQNQADFHPGSSSAVPVSNMRLVDQFSDVNNDVVINSDKIVNYTSSGITPSAFKCHSSIMGEEKSVNLKKKPSSSTRSVIEKVNVQSAKQSSLNENFSRQATNGNNEDYMSDSSEELQYGPGIVSKLKTKYLSMTLKESQKRNVRPSLSNLRRATSLENMLDEDSCSNKSTTHTQLSARGRNTQFTKVTANIPHSKYLRTNRNDSMKRACSMDTLLKTDIKTSVDILKSGRPRSMINDIPNGKANVASIINEDLIIVEQSSVQKENLSDQVFNDEYKHSSSRTDKELPRPDVVKQTLKFFETSPTRKNKHVLNQANTNSQSVVQNTNRLNASIEKQKVVTNKPQISPKPSLSPEKLRQNRSSKTSPKKVQNSNAIIMSSTHSKQEKDHQVLGPLTVDTSSSEKPLIHSPRIVSPRCISPVVTVVSNTEQNHSPTPSSSSKQNSVNRPDTLVFHSSSSDNNEDDDFSDEEEASKISKPVSQTALENIRKGGLSMHFSFGSDKTTKNKSYLPGTRIHPQATNTALVAPSNHISSEKTPVLATVTPLKSPDSPVTQTKQIGVIRPIITNKLQNTNSQMNSSTPALTEQEIEKNLINRVKSIEQPVSKVVVAIKSLPDSMVVSSVSTELSNKGLSLPRVSTSSETKSQSLWDKRPWHQNQNTMVFNFSNRKDVPDYIENDGLILRGKRERPRPGEGGIILLDSGVEESSTDGDCDDWTLDPPSPCDVVFEGDNILINGKSNLSRNPKQRKLRIQFNDAATTMFEYPSESSLVEEDPTTTASVEAAASSAPGVAISLGGSLGSYTPRQLGQGAGETWQLGVTRSVSTCVSAQVVSANNIVTTSIVSETHIKPAPPECTVAWSEETATDLLF